MLQAHTADNGVRFYFSPLLRSAGISHAFSTRVGGISPPPFDSLNLGNPSGCESQDDYERIWENYRLLHAAAGCAAAEKPCRVHQVHGAGVVRVRVGETFDTNAKADAIVSDDPSRVISVRVADCVPVLIATKDGRRVAAVHAGWRGVVAGVVPTAIAEIVQMNERGELLAAIGPCIGYDAFEVGTEVLAKFRRVLGANAPCREMPGGKGRVDLREAVRRQLIAAGMSDDRIDRTDRCTHEHREEFYSHRRDAGVTGRMAAVIQARE
ncbi:MAG TPA: peptidoglycan editing factor PgeF [Verrucomicrobiaceae bacterium]